MPSFEGALRPNSSMAVAMGLRRERRGISLGRVSSKSADCMGGGVRGSGFMGMEVGKNEAAR